MRTRNLTAWIAIVAVMPTSAAADARAPVRVAYDELLATMRRHQTFNFLATTNGGRLQAEVLIDLARAAVARDPGAPPLLIGHDEWFRALLAVTGTPADRAPAYAVLAWRHGQDIVADPGGGSVVEAVIEGPAPRLALDVRIAWPDRPGAASEYSYDDALSTPHLKVTNKRVITYRLLDFGDAIAFDEIDGLTGRPTSGALGLLFQLIGEGRVVEYRMAVAPDGRVVSRGRARKAFLEVSTTVTVQPDGRSEKGVPDDPGLRALEERLKRPMRLRYRARRTGLYPPRGLTVRLSAHPIHHASGSGRGERLIARCPSTTTQMPANRGANR